MVRLFLNKQDFETNTASARTIENVRKISEEFGFVKVTTHGNVARQILRILKYTFRSGAVLLVYPKFISPTHFDYINLRLFVQRLLKYRKKFIYYVTDLPVEQQIALEVPVGERERSIEKRILSLADCIIVFDQEMQDLLVRNYGLDDKLFVHSELLDYVVDTTPQSRPKTHSKGIGIVYAGGLEQYALEESIKSLPSDDGIPVEYHLFGPGGEWTENIRRDILYHGSRNFTEIVDAIKEYHFGLILAALSERMGQYLSLGPTNRFSLYMAAGIPVVVPRSFGYAAKIVEKYNVGLVFNDIKEIPSLVSQGMERYEEYLENVQLLQRRTTTGYHLRTALSKCMGKVFE